MSEAIFGLIGVVIGGLITGVMSLVIEWRRELSAARAGARILTSDLMDAIEQIQHALANGVRWPVGIPLATRRWADHEAILARRLREDEWFMASTAFDFLEGINQFDQIYRSDTGIDRVPLDEQGRAQLQLAIQISTVGQIALKRLAEKQSPYLRIFARPIRHPEVAKMNAMLAEVDQSIDDVKAEKERP